MARSPLTSLLRGWSASIERDAGVERREPVDGRRRGLLVGGACAAGTLTIGTRPVLGQAATPRIAVVGAGLAGLTAAYRLKQSGYDPVVYEGSTRVGGRCTSARDVFTLGQLAERGGEFIDTRHAAVRSLAGELGLTLDDVLAAQAPGSTEKYWFNDACYDLAAATRDYRSLYPTVQAQSAACGEYDYASSNDAAKFFDAMTVRAWIHRYVPGGASSRLGQLLDNALSEENGAGTDQQSALNIIGAIAPDAADAFNLYYTASDQRFRVRGGNDQIAVLLARALGDAVRPGLRLTAVTRRDDGRVALTLARDASLRDAIFDRVILTVPFSVMRAAVDTTNAGFRDLKQRAIRELGMGASLKTQVQVQRRLWRDTGCNGEIRLPSRMFQTSWDATRAQPGTAGILAFWSDGRQAAADVGLADQDRVRACLADAEAILPGLGASWNGIATVDAWGKSPWSLGSYSYYRPGYQTTLAGIEKEPEGHCFFAGEHTWAENGYLNAAVASGDRAARQVSRSLRP